MADREFTTYISLVDLRSRCGFSATVPSDAALTKLLNKSCKFIESKCRCWFVSRTMTRYFDGSMMKQLWLDIPLVSVTSITLDGSALTVYDPDDEDGEYVNHALGQECLDPASFSPYLELVTGKWGKGSRNVKIVGAWGWVDEDLKTPEPILDAVARLCSLYNTPMKSDHGIDRMRAGEIRSESVADRSVSWGSQGSGALVSDPIVRMALRNYRMKPLIGVKNQDELYYEDIKKI